MEQASRLADLLARMHSLRRQGQTPTPEEICADCPELLDDFKSWLADLTADFPSGQQPATVSLAALEAGSTVSHSPLTSQGRTGPAAVPGYEILAELGRGGMGVVYKARHQKLGRVVALKMILAGAHAGPDDLDRFRTEAEAVARLQHPNIVQIHEVGEHDGLPFFSLEFCAGGTLSQKTQGTPLPPMEAARMVETLARGMHAAHKNNVVHRDLKPANVLLTEDGTPKISDFGLAKKLDDAGQTQTGAIMGTPSFMAPEQAAGKSKELGPNLYKMDVYSLGAILYDLLTGRPPFKGTTTAETLMQVVHHEPVPPSQLQPKTLRDLETICLKCLHKDAGRRYATCLDLAEDLRRFQAGEPITARPVGRAERVWRWCRRNPALAASSAFAATVVLAFLTGTLWYLHQEAERAREDGERAVAKARLDVELAAKDKANEKNVAAELDVADSLQSDLIARRTDPDHVSELLSKIDDWQQIRNGIHKAYENAKNQAGARGEDQLDAVLASRLRQLKTDLAAVDRDWHFAKACDDARLTTDVDGKLDFLTGARLYPDIFMEAGFDVVKADIDVLAERMNKSDMRLVYLVGLEHWADVAYMLKVGKRPDYDPQRVARLLALANRLDGNPWRTELRQPEVWQSKAKIRLLAQKIDLAEKHSPQILTALAVRLDKKEAVALLQRAMTDYPRDFWIHFTCGNMLIDPTLQEGCFRTALAIRPESATTLYNLGLALGKQKRLDEKLKALNKAILFDQKYAAAYNSRGLLWESKKDYDKALADYNEAIRLNPQYAPTYHSRGLLWESKKDYDKALADYNEAIRLKPQYAPTYCSRGNLWQSKKDYDKALADYNEAIRLDRQDATAYCNRGLLLQRKKDYDKALDDYNDAIRLDPQNAAAYHNRGLLWHIKKDHDKALADYNEAIRLDPQLARAYNNRGHLWHIKKDYDKALADYNEAIRLDRQDAMAYYNRGLLWQSKKEYDKAQADYDEAIRLDPQFVQAYYNRGNVWKSKKEYDKALADYNEAIRLDPQYANAYAGRGLVWVNKQEHDKALADYDEAIRLDPHHASAYNYRGNLWTSKKEYDKALPDYNEAIRLDPQFVQAYYNRGNVWKSKKEYDKALADYSEAIRLNPEFPEAHCHQGLVQRSMGDFAGALKHLRRGHELGTKTPGWANPSAAWVKECEQLLAMDERLPLVLAEKVPATAPEMISLADMCQRFKKHYAAAATLFQRAFAAEAKLAEGWARQLRYNAACYAALAGTGQGKDAGKLTDEDKSKFRSLARGWLKADLEVFTRRLEENNGVIAWQIEQRLLHWHKDADLAAVRDAAALAKLPAEEGKLWQAVWGDAARLLKEAQGKFKVTRTTGELTAKEKSRVHEQKVLAGHVYVIDLESSRFDTFLKLEDAKGKLIAQKHHISPDHSNSRLILNAPVGGVARIVATSFEEAGIGQFTLTVREIKGPPAKADPIKPKEKEIIHPGEPANVGDGLSFKGELGEATSVLYKVNFVQGKTYVIDMVSPDQKALDPYLFLLDAAGKKLAEDDDGGGGLNARITYRATLSGFYQIRATSFNAGRGPFTLTVREEK